MFIILNLGKYFPSTVGGDRSFKAAIAPVHVCAHGFRSFGLKALGLSSPLRTMASSIPTVSEDKVSAFITDIVDAARCSERIALPMSHCYPSFVGRRVRPQRLQELNLNNFWFTPFRPYEPIFVVKKTDSHYIVVGGNHRVEAARRTGVLVAYAHIMDFSIEFYEKHKSVIALTVQSSEVINEEFTVLEQLLILRDCITEWETNYPGVKLTFSKCCERLFADRHADAESVQDMKKRHFMLTGNKTYYRGAKKIFSAAEDDGSFSVLQYLEDFQQRYPGVSPWTRMCILNAAAVKDPDLLLAEVKKWRDSEHTWIKPLLSQSEENADQRGVNVSRVRKGVAVRQKRFAPLLTEAVVKRIANEEAARELRKRSSEVRDAAEHDVRRLPKRSRSSRWGPRQPVVPRPSVLRDSPTDRDTPLPFLEELPLPSRVDRVSQDEVQVQSPVLSPVPALTSSPSPGHAPARPAESQSLRPADSQSPAGRDHGSFPAVQSSRAQDPTCVLVRVPVNIIAKDPAGTRSASRSATGTPTPASTPAGTRSASRSATGTPTPASTPAGTRFCLLVLLLVLLLLLLLLLLLVLVLLLLLLFSPSHLQQYGLLLLLCDRPLLLH